ncbi:MAG: Anaerobic glycerol-3-phosphate dehydrogenase subunit [Pseudomonadota bacterium]
MREGSLEAPTRHPIDWQSEAFYDEKACFDEMERIFDICHGCRRCVSLCQSFPTLFDRVDESETMEVDGVSRNDYMKVVDQCYLCDLCYLTKCPYVPPHEWNLDFPHVMLRAKAIAFKKGTSTQFRDVQLASTDRNGKLAGIPIVVQAVNALAKNDSARKLGESMLGVHREAWVPEFAPKSFRSQAQTQRAVSTSVKNGERTPGKVAIFSTCYVNYNEPGIGQDLIKILDHNQIPWILAEKEACCGMPKLELGDLDSVAELKAKNMPVLAKLAREGYAILAAIPSCGLMFKQELPLMFPNCPDTQAVKAAMFDPFEYFTERSKDGLLDTGFKVGLGHVSYHIACHLRVQNMGQRTKDLLSQVPETKVHTVERCSGHAGTWGVKKEFFDNAMKIGKPVFKQMSEHPAGKPDWIASDCQLAGHHIAQGMERNKLNEANMAHPLTLLRMAYGI